MRRYQNLGALFAPLWSAVADHTHAYRAVFFAGFVLIRLGFLGFTILSGFSVWVSCAFLLGFGTGASNTVVSLFVVKFTPKDEWSQRISWLQTFNAIGSALGMAIAGLLEPRAGTLIASISVIPAIVLGGRGLPVPGGRFHIPHPHLSGSELKHLQGHAGPNAATVVAYLHRPRLAEFAALGNALTSGFGLFLVSWFVFSMAVSSFGSLYPVLMLKGFGFTVAQSSLLIFHLDCNQHPALQFLRSTRVPPRSGGHARHRHRRPTGQSRGLDEYLVSRVYPARPTAKRLKNETNAQ